MPRPTSANASSTNSRTERVSPVASTNRPARRLQYPVHALDIIPGVTPVAFRPEISEIKRVFETGLDAGDRRA